MTDVRPLWRLVITPPAAGSWNMAVDEALAAAGRAAGATPVLRLYQWQPACVSLGRHQPLTDVDRARCTALGYDVVRRPTGGRAILHTDELTYSVAGSQSDAALAGAVLDSYLRLSQGLLLGLAHLGVAAEKAPLLARTDSQPGPVCFEVPSAYEIVVDGKKLIGSAQSRRSGWVLQHGTLPLTGDITRLVEVVHFAEDAARAEQRALLHQRATTVQAVLGRAVPFAEAAAAFVNGFAVALGINFERRDLDAAELAQAAEIEQRVYGSAQWTERV
ncbi:MAG: octanoyltransferase [Caldilineales bacterium]